MRLTDRRRISSIEDKIIDKPVSLNIFELQHRDYDENSNKGSFETLSCDPAIKKIPRNSPAFLVWRIERLRLVPVARETHGTFYSSEVYLVYSASSLSTSNGQNGTSNGSPTNNSSHTTLETHIHFWLGNHATHDKTGAAAYKTVELDGQLTQKCTVHRETEACESARFRGYFKQGITVLAGSPPASSPAAASPPEPPARLYHIHPGGITEASEISWSNFASDRVLLLVICPKEKEGGACKAFVWCGRAALDDHKIRAVQMAKKLSQESPMEIVFMDDGYERTLSDSDRKEFDKYLSLQERVVRPHWPGATEPPASDLLQSMKLYQCNDAEGKYRIAEIKSAPLIKTDLDSSGVYIIDNCPRVIMTPVYNDDNQGQNENTPDLFDLLEAPGACSAIFSRATCGVWIWVGNRAPAGERAEAVRNARGYVKKKRYPDCTPVVRVVEGAEPNEFKAMFKIWNSGTNGNGNGPRPGSSAVSGRRLDAETLMQRPQLAAETQLVDDGSGQIRTWVVKDGVLQEQNQKKFGLFFTQESYVVQYRYRMPTGNKCIIYFWLGFSSNNESKMCAEEKAAEKDFDMGGDCVVVRVVQGGEPAHFLQMFRGKMITYMGKNTRDMSSSTYMLNVQGEGGTAKAWEVPATVSSLRPGNCYVLRVPPNTPASSPLASESSTVRAPPPSQAITSATILRAGVDTTGGGSRIPSATHASQGESSKHTNSSATVPSGGAHSASGGRVPSSGQVPQGEFSKPSVNSPSGGAVQSINGGRIPSATVASQGESLRNTTPSGNTLRGGADGTSGGRVPSGAPVAGTGNKTIPSAAMLRAGVEAAGGGWVPPTPPPSHDEPSRPKCYVWCGTGATGDQREAAKNIARGNDREPDYELIVEGKEPDEFWRILGGSGLIVSQSRPEPKQPDSQPPRMFHTSTTGLFAINEIMNFTQSDLSPESIMLLDAFNFMFIWIGQYSKQNLAAALETGKKYLETDAVYRLPSIPMIIVKQYHEPPNFIGLFPSWDNNQWQDYQTFDQLRKSIEQEQAASFGAKTNGSAVGSSKQCRNTEFDRHCKYSIEVLRGDQSKLPCGVNLQKKELHLTHDDFIGVFDMDYSEFEKLPCWKQQDLKKKVGLF